MTYFNPEAIPKCHDRLSKARRALQKCRSAHNFKAFSSFWSDFLIHTGSVLNALDAGAKLTPQGKQWYGGIKREGRNDPLVSYMHQARNAEEHALNPTTKMSGASINIGAPGEAVFVNDLTLNDAFYRNPEKAIVGRAWRTSDGKPPTIARTPSGPALIPVSDDRYAITFQPPREHLGKPLPKRDPISVAEHYLIYLESLTLKAEELA